MHVSTIRKAVGGCVCVCVCVCACMRVLKGCWPLEGSHTSALFVFLFCFRCVALFYDVMMTVCVIQGSGIAIINQSFKYVRTSMTTSVQNLQTKPQATHFLNYYIKKT